MYLTQPTRLSEEFLQIALMLDSFMSWCKISSNLFISLPFSELYSPRSLHDSCLNFPIFDLNVPQRYSEDGALKKASNFGALCGKVLQVCGLQELSYTALRSSHQLHAGIFTLSCTPTTYFNYLSTYIIKLVSISAISYCLLQVEERAANRTSLYRQILIP